MEFTNDWFHDNGTDKVFEKFVVPQLAHRPVRWLEIGSFEGRSAVWSLENFLQHACGSLICVDPWEGWSLEAYDRFLRNLEEAGGTAKTSVHRDYAMDALTEFRAYSCDRQNNWLDGAFIDGNHEAKDALQEGLLCWDLLKPGGILVFDDYIWEWEAEHGNQVPVAVGIDAFLAVVAPWSKVLHKDRHVVVEKTK